MRIVMFTRYPRAGETKTRLIPALGARGAAELQRRMTEFILRRIRDRGSSGRELEIRYTGATAQQMCGWLGEGLRFAEQGKGDLGARLHRAVRDAFEDGVNAVVLVGSDCPEIDVEAVGEALEAVRDNRVVMGPATDGGYYLMALGRDVPELFSGVPWGTDGVLARTVEIARRQGLDVISLPERRDVDLPDDLAVWDQSAGDDVRSRLSVVIPALNEAPHISEVIARALSGCNVACLVVDGGSRDRTVSLAAAAGAKVIESAPGRAAQQVAGVRATEGAILLFLHADTLLPERYDQGVRRTLLRPGTSGGAFRFGVNAVGRPYRWVEAFTNLRARWLQMPYGDQAIFCRRETYEDVGGIPQMPLMEDVAFVRRLRQKGRVRLAPGIALTSARRWQKLGVWRTTWRNQLLLAAYFAGVNPRRLARAYERERGVARP